MDIVYTLGGIQKWKYNELRFSLRSLAKHLQGWHNIYVIGDNPGFLSSEGVHILPYPDRHDMSVNKEINIFEKICHACEQSAISDNFLFINDDHFFLRSFHISQLPSYHRGELEPSFVKRPPGDPYRLSLKNTWQALKAKNKPTLHFDVHFPIVYNKKKFLNLRDAYDWTLTGGYVIKSLYSNHWHIEGEFYEDAKIDKRLSVPDILYRTTGRPLFSIGDKALCTEMKAWLQHLYPDPFPAEADEFVFLPVKQQ